MEDKKIEEIDTEEGEEVKVIDTSVFPSLDIAVPVGIFIGIVSLIVGAATKTSWVSYVGLTVAPISLFGGAFMMKEENNFVRLGMLIAGGYLLSRLAGYAFNIIIYSRGS